MKKQNEEKEVYEYSYKTLEKFANLIVFDYRNDLDKFLKDRKALTQDGKVIEYKNVENYYTGIAKDFKENDDFFEPKMPKAFWDRLYKQAEHIMLAKIETFYETAMSENGVDIRGEKMAELREGLTKEGILQTPKNVLQ